MRTFLYVDGFNLYYGALRGTPWKWLGLPAQFEKVLQPHHDILTVKNFTARVSSTLADPSKPQRQDVYLRALQHYRTPVFSERDSVTTVILIGGYAWMAADEFDAPFSDRDREALTTFECLAADPKFRVSFQLERGEAVLFNNCAVLHNRTAFEDHDEPHLKHHLMRLWLMDWDGRPVVEGCGTTRVKGGITPQRDKEPYYANRNPAIDSARRRGSPL